MDTRPLYLKTLGDLALQRSGPGGPTILSNKKPLGLLALLATMPGATASRDYLAELLWPGVEHERARRSLRQALYQLSKKSGRDLIIARDTTLSLNDDLVAVDLWEFERAMEERDYARAVGLAGGPFLQRLERKAGGELSQWIEAQNERLGAALQVAYAETIAEAVRAGDLEAALKHARANAARNPLDEAGQVLLIRTLRAAGRDVEALQSYQVYRKQLADALGDVPGEELERSAARVREALLAPLERMLRSELNELAVERLVLGDVPVARPRWVTAAIGGAAGAAVVAIGLLGWVVLDRHRATPPLDDLHGTLIARTVSNQLIELQLRGRHVDQLPPPSVENPEFYVPSPDGSRLASTIDVSDGVNTVVRNLAGGEVEVLAEGPDDEYPVDWSPDGRYLLYTYGHHLDDENRYEYRLAIHDMLTGARRPVGSRPFSGSDRMGFWSPDGTRIAFTEKHGTLNRVAVVDFDGGEERVVSPVDEWSAGGAWSPDGTRLAFAVGTPRSTSTSLYVVRPDGSELRQVPSRPGRYEPPFWLSDRVVVAAVDRAGERDVLAIDVATGEERRLTTRGDIRAVFPPYDIARRKHWIENVKIQAGPAVVAPGQRLALKASLTDDQGKTLINDDVPIRWSVTDGSPAELDPGGHIVVTGPGTIGIIGSAAGWRGDTVQLISRPLVELPLQPAFQDDWTHGLRGDPWIVHGEPLPYVRQGDGPRGAGAFISNGDRTYRSGAVTRQSFPLAEGLTVEVFGRLPFSGHLYENFDIALLADPLPPDSTDWTSRYGADPFLQLHIGGYRQVAELRSAGGRELAPYPSQPGKWHLYSLQLDPDGTVSYLFDGDLTLVLAHRLAVDSISEVHVGIGGASYNTEIMHGPVAVYRGLKYVLPGTRQ